MKILCIGHASWDITTVMDEYPVENSKNRVYERHECGGGPASTAAYLLGKWGMDTTIMAIIGDDYYGDNIKKEFDDISVNTKYLEMSPLFKTTSSHIVANRQNGSRTTLTYRPSDIEMSDIELDFEPDIILVDGQEPELSKKIISKYPKAISVIDAGRDKNEVIELAHMVNYLVCSRDFAEKVTSLKIDYNISQSLQDIYTALESMFKNNIVITLEDKGCLYKYDNVIKIMPSIKVKPLDTTGAGDIFHGAFVYGLANNFDLEKNLKLSNIAGAISITRVGTRNSIPTMEEMTEVYNEFK